MRLIKEKTTAAEERLTEKEAQDAQAEKDLEFVRNKLGQGKEPRSREPLSERLDRLKESPRRSSPVPFNLERDVSSGNVRSERPPHPSYVPEGWGGVVEESAYTVN